MGEHEINDSLTLLSLPGSGTKARASSVLQKNVKLYGPHHALDTNNGSSCWNSNGGGDSASSSWLWIDFGRSVTVRKVAVQFQAGFSAACTTMKVPATDEPGSWNVGQDDIEWDDTYELQSVELEQPCQCTAMQLTFEDFTDFYGRVTIYRLEVWGKEE